VTADRRRRRRSMWLAFTAAVVALVGATVLSGVAVVSMSNSTAGRDVADDLGITDTVQRLPWTSTALVGVIDQDGTLTSTVVAVLPPEGRGGTIVSISASADAASGTSTIIRSLDAVFAVEGAEAWRAAVEQLSGLSFDLAEVVDEQRFTELVSPLGDLPTIFPFSFTDANTGSTFDSGQDVLSAASAARAVTARNAAGPAWQFDPARDAVWAAIANRVGAGIGSLPADVRFDRGNAPTSLDQFIDALFAAPTEFRGLSSAHVDTERVAAQMPLDHADFLGEDFDESVVALNRSETVLVFGSIAPARVGAPFDGPTARVMSGFTDADVESLGMNRSDVIVSALDVLLFAQTNVRSVVDDPDAVVPEATQIVVADPALVEGVWSIYDGLFGELQVSVTDVRIEGIDFEIRLGREYLDVLRQGGDPVDALIAETTTTVGPDASGGSTADVASSTP
jgi:hypothetical protein